MGSNYHSEEDDPIPDDTESDETDSYYDSEEENSS